MTTELVLNGIDGANPLGFLAAVGCLALLSSAQPQMRLAWRPSEGTWRPVISGLELRRETGESEESAFVRDLYLALATTSHEPFEIDRRLPFPSTALINKLRDVPTHGTAENRRTADVLAAFGSEAVIGDKGNFEATAFCMVRSGDSAGNGLPAYALELQKLCGEKELSRALFKRWDYLDQGPSLRWDPAEDRRYALTWVDPKKDSKNKPVMIGANVLALEALRLFPSVSDGTRLRTTGFAFLSRNHMAFTWPIWESWLNYDELRSTVGIGELNKPVPDRAMLERRGIVEIFRSERIAPNQYYKNFTPARPA